MHNKNDLPQQPPRSSKQLKIITLIAAVLLIVLVAGTGGYLLGSRNNWSTLPSQPSPLPQSTRTSQNAQRVSFHPSPTIIPSPTLLWLSDGLVISPTPTPEVHWITYTDAKFGATFEYPSTWSITYADKASTHYSLTFMDAPWPKNTMTIYINARNYPENISLADFYRRYAPGGAERFKNISFQETVNSHGVKFWSIVQPFTNPDTLETVHNGRMYEITKVIAKPETIDEYNHLISTFSFTGKETN